MILKQVSELDIVLKKNPISFWTNNSSSNIIRIIYLSYTSRDKEMVADINLEDGTIIIYSLEDTHSIVSSFIGSNLSLQEFRQMQITGVDRGIINQCISIVENKISILDGNDESDYRYNILLSHMESINYDYLYFDAQVITIPGIIKRKIDQLYITNFLDISEHKRSNCYCGITNDIDRRMDEHRNEDFQIYQNKVFAIVCRNKDIAVETERLLSVDYSISKRARQNNEVIAGRGAESDTSIVYLLKPFRR